MRQVCMSAQRAVLALTLTHGRLSPLPLLHIAPNAVHSCPAIALPATILIATLSYYFLEKPILNLKDRFFAWSKASDDERPEAIL